MALKHTPHFFRGGLATFIILGVVFLGALAITGGLLPSKRKPPPENPQAFDIRDSIDNSSQKNLQLKNPVIVTPTPPPLLTPASAPTPTPENICNSGGIFNDPDSCICRDFEVECRNKICVRVRHYATNPWTPCSIYNSNPVLRDFFRDWCGGQPVEGGYNCVTKPVIYLYPTKKTLVDVSVETEGKIVVSDPLYPVGGWKNVLAFPDGKLIYQNKEYRELFYESDVKDIKEPKEGLVVSRDNIEKTLENLISNLGLIDYEKKELLDWWIPRLKALNSSYLFISVLDRSEKERTDKVLISPKPDTLIDFILYFKPLDKPIEVKPLDLPQTPPERIGFTSVEWGGTIEY